MLANRHHIPIIDADLIARQVVEPGTSGYNAIVSHFGPDRILGPEQEDGTRPLNRAALGEIIFNDPDQRKWLNGVTHPRVRKAILKNVLQCWLRGEWCVILDVPLLIEANLYKWVGSITVVYVYVTAEIILTNSNESLQLARLLSRPPLPGQAQLTKAAAQSRINSQLSLSSKLPYADHVLDNSGTPKDLQQQVDFVVAKWKKSQGGETGWWWRLCWILPPLGIWVGAWALVWREVRRWRRVGKDKGRRRARGETTRRDHEDERIELREIGRRRTSGSDLLD